MTREPMFVHDCRNEHHGEQCRTRPCRCECHGGRDRIVIATRRDAAADRGETGQVAP